MVLIRNVDAERFSAQMEAFADTLRNNDLIASFGYEVGTGTQALQVINAAEQMMYRNKAAYYQETGKQRR